MRRGERNRPEPKAIGVLDIGTAKVCCLIAAPDAGGQLELMGLGHQRSMGVKSGTIVDADEAERAVRAAVAQAERMAGVVLERISLTVSCGRIRSSSFVARALVEGPVVRDDDLARVLSGGEAFVERGGRLLVQLTRSEWRLDAARGIRDPRGLAGRELSVELHAVTADEAPVRNLLSIAERCHLAVDGMIAAPFASALAVATAEERAIGALVVDVGAGVTSLAAFVGGRLVHTDAIPVGGQHVTFDVARVLVTSAAEAERIKTLYGTLVKAASDSAEVFSYPVAGEEEPSLFQVSKARLREVIEPRIANLLGLIHERLGEAGLASLVSGRVILTGGGSQLLGLDQAWTSRFGGVVRIGRPRPIGRMPASMCSPAFSTVIGLALSEATPEPGLCTARGAMSGSDGYLGRMRQWISESF